MLRSRRNVGKHRLRCYFGCCLSVPSDKMERRIIKRKEAREWKKDQDVAG